MTWAKEPRRVRPTHEIRAEMALSLTEKRLQAEMAKSSLRMALMGTGDQMRKYVNQALRDLGDD